MVTISPTPASATLSRELSPETAGRILLSVSTTDAPLRVAFVGQAGTGKTTHAHLLRQRFKGDVLSFASPIKKISAEMFDNRMLDPQFARTANQEVGVLGRRLAGPDIWLNQLLAKVSRTRNCFVDDCRYMSEYHALRRLDFIVIKLVAPMGTLEERRPTMTRDQWQHESERDGAFIYADAFFDTHLSPEKETHDAIVAAILALRATA